MRLTFSHFSSLLAFQQSSGITFSLLLSSQVSALMRREEDFHGSEGDCLAVVLSSLTRDAGDGCSPSLNKR